VTCDEHEKAKDVSNQNYLFLASPCMLHVSRFPASRTHHKNMESSSESGTHEYRSQALHDSSPVVPSQRVRLRLVVMGIVYEPLVRWVSEVAP
jgi:hypothetical protein